MSEYKKYIVTVGLLEEEDLWIVHDLVCGLEGSARCSRFTRAVVFNNSYDCKSFFGAFRTRKPISRNRSRRCLKPLSSSI